MSSITSRTDRKGRRTHGMSRTRTYRRWWKMRQRCQDPRNRSYNSYGGRGIAVCDRWQVFTNFYEDMGECPTGYVLARLDKDGAYEPSNCRWAAPTDRTAKGRRGITLTHNGLTLTIAEWSDRAGIKSSTIHDRLRKSWPVDRALTKPVPERGPEELTYHGLTLPTKEWAKRVGIRKDTIYARLRTGWSVERALMEPVGGSTSRSLTYQGTTMTVKDWAARVGLTTATLKARLKKGWPVGRALSEPCPKWAGRMLTYQGTTLTIREWAHRLNMSVTKLAARITQGWSLDRVLAKPTGRGAGITEGARHVRRTG